MTIDWLSQSLTLLGQVVTGGIGAYLALWAKDRSTRADQYREADIKTLEAFWLALPPQWVKFLAEVDFADVVATNRLLAPESQLDALFPSNKRTVFHDPQLNDCFRQLRCNVRGFVSNVRMNSTLVERVPLPFGPVPRNPPPQVLRVRPEVASDLGAEAERLHAEIGAFEDLAKRRLRI